MPFWLVEDSTYKHIQIILYFISVLKQTGGDTLKKPPLTLTIVCNSGCCLPGVTVLKDSHRVRVRLSVSWIFSSRCTELCYTTYIFHRGLIKK